MPGTFDTAPVVHALMVGPSRRDAPRSIQKNVKSMQERPYTIGPRPIRGCCKMARGPRPPLASPRAG